MLGDADCRRPSHRVAALAARRGAPVRSGGTRRRSGSAARSGAISTGSCSRRCGAGPDPAIRTANALAARHRAAPREQPVVARPPTRGYTASKFVRRHRLGVAMAGGRGGGAGRAGHRASRGSGTGPSRKAKGPGDQRVPPRMLKSADPWQGGARQTTVVEALRAGVAQVNAGSHSRPVVAASIKRTIGTVYLGLGRFLKPTRWSAPHSPSGSRGPDPREEESAESSQRPRPTCIVTRGSSIRRRRCSSERWRCDSGATARANARGREPARSRRLGMARANITVRTLSPARGSKSSAPYTAIVIRRCQRSLGLARRRAQAGQLPEGHRRARRHCDAQGHWHGAEPAASPNLKTTR